MKNIAKLTVIVALSLWGIASCQNSEWYQHDKFKSELAKTPKGTAWYEKSETGMCKLMAVNA